jgi:hypothetical protein
MITSLIKFYVLALSLNFHPNSHISTQDSDPNEIHYEVLDKVLSKYVDGNGKVDYKKIATDSLFNAVHKNMSKLFPDNTWSREQQISYWINMYNVSTIKLICDHYPIKSIMDIDMAFDLLIVKLGKKEYSLNQIEKVMLNKFNDPRIHFAINCGAVSCPPLLNKSFRALSLNKTLRERTVSFINDPLQNEISTTELKLSKIFEWYKEDFTKTNITLITYLNQFSKVQIVQGLKITYKEYDWSLNKK